MKRNMIPFLMAMFNAENQQRYARIRQTGGHRARGYSVTQHDLDRIQAAAERAHQEGRQAPPRLSERAGQ